MGRGVMVTNDRCTTSSIHKHIPCPPAPQLLCWGLAKLFKKLIFVGLHHVFSFFLPIRLNLRGGHQTGLVCWKRKIYSSDIFKAIITISICQIIPTYLWIVYLFHHSRYEVTPADQPLHEPRGLGTVVFKIFPTVNHWNSCANSPFHRLQCTSNYLKK